MTKYQVINKEGEVTDTYSTLETARTFRRISNIITPGHTVRIFPTPPDKPLEVGDRYMDSLGFVLTINEIDEEDGSLYLDDPDHRYGNWQGRGAIFPIEDFKEGMQLIID